MDVTAAGVRRRQFRPMAGLDARAPARHVAPGLAPLPAQHDGMLGLGLVGLVVLVALACPLLAPFDPNDQSAMMNFGVARGAEPEASAWDGQHGIRRAAAAVVYGAPTALAVGLGAMLVASVIGMIIGGVSGYLGGMADELMMRLHRILPRDPGLRRYPCGRAPVRDYRSGQPA